MSDLHASSSVNASAVSGSSADAAAKAAYDSGGDPEAVANAAIFAVCSAATGGAGAPACAFFTVDNMLAVSDWIVSHLPGDWQAKGVFECWFYFKDVQNNAWDAYIALTTALNTAWHASRKAMGLPPAENPDAVPEYSPATHVTGPDAIGNYHGTESPAKLIGYQSRMVAQFLSTDKDWNSYPSVVWAEGTPFARRISLSKDHPFWLSVDPNSNPITDCRNMAPQWNSIGANLLATYRLAPVKRATQMAVKEMARSLEFERSARSGSGAATLLTVLGLSAAAGLGYWFWRRK